MKRVMVVDDERPVVDGLVRTIRQTLNDEFEVVATASSGREALELAEVTPVEVIILDVRMPGLTGLETIRELKRRGSRATFILSTAYERFDIVRDALELGVAGYLLKPVVGDKLAQALRTAALWIDRQRERDRAEFEAREKDREVRSLVMRAYLGSLMLGPSDLISLKTWRDWLGLPEPWALVAVVAWSGGGAVHSTVEAALQFKTQALCGPALGDRCAVLVPLAAAERREDVKSEVIEVARASVANLPASPELRFGFSEVKPLESLGEGWLEALSDLSHGSDSRENEQLSSERLSRSVDDANEARFWEAFDAGDTESARRSFEALVEPLESRAEVPVQERYRVIGLLASALTRLRRRGRLDNETVWHWLDLDELRSASSGPEFCLAARARLPVVLSAAGRSRERSLELSKALDVVQHHYGDVLTLESVAEAVGVTPKRLSRLFVEELGQGFSDYLISFRIEKAKILLTIAGSSVKEVSTECGYPDPNYFARLFKKVTGQTPTEFSASRGNTLPIGRTPGIMER